MKGWIVLKKKNFEIDFIDDICSTASATECTGLIQIPPMCEEESEAYSEIYRVPEQVTNYKKADKPKGRAIKSAPDIEKQSRDGRADFFCTAPEKRNKKE